MISKNKLAKVDMEKLLAYNTLKDIFSQSEGRLTSVINESSLFKSYFLSLLSNTEVIII